MKCERCGAWTRVLETRQADRGHTTVRTHECANGHRFKTFEVLGPIYRRSPAAVRKTVVAAEVRAAMWRRDTEVLRALQSQTPAAVGVQFNLNRKAVSAIARRRRTR